MSQEFGGISPRFHREIEYQGKQLSLTRESCVAFGKDSHVFHCDNLAIKLYGIGDAFNYRELVQKYQELTNDLAQRVDTNSIAVELPNCQPIRIKINPILNVPEESMGVGTISISPWVDGLNFAVKDRESASWEDEHTVGLGYYLMYPSLYKQMSKKLLKNGDLNSESKLIFEKLFTTQFEQAWQIIFPINEVLNKLMGMTTIAVGNMNLKLSPDGFVVTDLGTDITDCVREYRKQQLYEIDC